MYMDRIKKPQLGENQDGSQDDNGTGVWESENRVLCLGKMVQTELTKEYLWIVL